MFLLVSRYVRPLPEIDAVLDEHRAFLRRYYDQRIFLASGPQVPRTGGVIVANCTSRDEAERIVAEDPFTQRSLAEYQIVEFTATSSAPEIAPLLQ
jgi:uncharacterized protein YciI